MPNQTYTPAQMATTIASIGQATLQQKITNTITQNGNVVVTPDQNFDGMSKVIVPVEVPNSYVAADEGKVISNGILVAQTAHADVTPTITDQTIDTTTNNSVTVNAITPRKVARTYTPGTSNQTIAAGQWLAGSQIILGDANLISSNIKDGVSIFGVYGTYLGGSLNFTYDYDTVMEDGTVYIAFSEDKYGYHVDAKYYKFETEDYGTWERPWSGIIRYRPTSGNTFIGLLTDGSPYSD